MRSKAFVLCWSMSLATFMMTLVVASSASAASEKVVYSFGNGSDAAHPFDIPVFDTAGNLYGTTWEGGPTNHGTVFELSPRSGGGWTETVLYNFLGRPTDGGKPSGSLIFDGAGNIYGTTRNGGSPNCQGACGTVFKLTPGNGTWTESVIYMFSGAKDGAYPYAGVIMDASGKLYGMTQEGGAHNFGTVFELSPSNGGWTENTLHSFNGTDGKTPVSGLTLDAAGNLYGTTEKGGDADLGVVFELSPSSGGWKETVLYAFAGGADGREPYVGVIFDTAGNLYGTTSSGGAGACAKGCGTVFELSPSGSGWTETVIYSFTGLSGSVPNDIVFDAAGNIYGTTRHGGTGKKCKVTGCGTVFELTLSNGTWTETVLHSFSGIPDGAVPFSGPLVDAKGNVFGTTVFGGKYHPGVLYEIHP